MAQEQLSYFVTGASGFIGRFVCANLIEKGHAVRALCRNPDQPFLTKLGVNICCGDIMQAASYAESLHGVDVVVHLAGDPVFGDGKHYMGINAHATGELLRALEGMPKQLKRFVLVSSFGAVDRGADDDCSGPVSEFSPLNPTTDYGRSKAEAERLVSECAVPWTIVRPAMVAGKEMRLDSHVSVFVRQALEERLFSRFAFPGCLSVVHVKDVAEALVMVSTHPNSVSQIYFIAGDKVSLTDIFNVASRGAFRLSLSGIAKTVRLMSRIVPFKFKALFMECLWASDDALRALGWEPQYSGIEAVEEVKVAWVRRKSLNEGIERFCMVTGAASGLGKAMAEQLHERGRRLVLVDKDETGLGRVLPNVDAVRIVCDLSSSKGLEPLLEHEVWADQGVDELYACAGFGARGLAKDVGAELQAAVIDVNLTARLRLALRAVSYMAPRKFGRIVFVSSSSAYQPLPYMTAYAASNAGLLSLGEGLYSEFADEGVEVLTICPGGMSTGFQQSAGVKVLPNEKLDTPEKVAKITLDALGDDRCTLMVGLRSKAMSYVARLLPRKINLALWERLMRSMR